jgi:hypothetical protein
VKIAGSYNGITGNTSLSQFGDRKYGDYVFGQEELARLLLVCLLGKVLANIYT